MHTKATIEPGASALPAGLPEPAGVADPAPSTRRRSPAHKVLAKLMRALRGDKYMANAYPPEWHSAADAGPLRQNATPSARAQVKER